MRLAYADPPYPGKAHLYPENTEVDHAELLARLCDYDGWALSTDERSLADVLALCPSGVRVCAWGRSNAAPGAVNPIESWEPVLVSPARKTGVELVRSYYVSGAPLGRAQVDGLTGQKPEGFCEWVIGLLGAEHGDALDDLFPGTGIMGRTWEKWTRQMRLPVYPRAAALSYAQRVNEVRRTHEPIDGMEPAPYARERSY